MTTKEGGENQVVSAVAAFNKLLDTDPDDAKRKYAGFGQFIADLWFVISSIFRA